MTYDTLGKTVPHREQFFFLGNSAGIFCTNRGNTVAFVPEKRYNKKEKNRQTTDNR